MAFTIRQLRYFLAAAESASVSGAAQALAISQSAVTEAIRDLEADLGVQLFERHPRGLDITPRGHQFLRHAQTILASVSDARQAMVAEAKQLSGKLNIGVTSLVAGYVISDVLARFRRANPGVEVAALEDAVRRKDVRLISRADLERSRRGLFGFSLPRIGLFGGGRQETDDEHSRTATPLG